MPGGWCLIAQSTLPGRGMRDERHSRHPMLGRVLMRGARWEVDVLRRSGYRDTAVPGFDDGRFDVSSSEDELGGSLIVRFAE